MFIVDPEKFLLCFERETQICLNCKHFHRVYTQSGSAMFALWQGQCAYPRLKWRKINDVCEHFQNKYVIKL